MKQPPLKLRVETLEIQLKNFKESVNHDFGKIGIMIKHFKHILEHHGLFFKKQKPK